MHLLCCEQPIICATATRVPLVASYGDLDTAILGHKRGEVVWLHGRGSGRQTPQVTSVRKYAPETLIDLLHEDPN